MGSNATHNLPLRIFHSSHKTERSRIRAAQSAFPGELESVFKNDNIVKGKTTSMLCIIYVREKKLNAVYVHEDTRLVLKCFAVS